LSLKLAFFTRNNISFNHYIISHLSYLKKPISHPYSLVNHVTSYRNCLEIIKASISGRYPVTGILKDGSIIELQNERVINLPWKKFSSQNGINGSEYNIKYDLLNKEAIVTSLSDNQKSAKICGGINDGDLWSIFVKDEYQRLPVKDKMVIDIGANIGDSPIYFALRGARKVIALEPCLESYSTAKVNLKRNDLFDKVSLILAGCSSSSGSIDVNHMHDVDNDDDLSLTHFNNDGTQFSLSRRQKNGNENHVYHHDDPSLTHFNNDNEVVPLLTIKDVLDKFEIDNKAVLKMDCEGCEYESILSTSSTTLQRFSHILIEYHYGYNDLKQKLKSSGFNVSISNPIYKRKSLSHEPSYLGYLYATLIDNGHV
jgi:FkbM family methyltransferase